MGSLTIPSYGLCVFLGIVACAIYIIVILKKIEKVDKKLTWKTIAVFAVSLICLYFFAAMFDALFHSIQVGQLVTNGITWEGGVIGGFAAFVLFTHFFIREKKGDALNWFSLIIPGVVLGHAFGRIGCFLGGCCYGKISFTMGIKFPEGSLADLQYPNNIDGSMPVIPTQLFEAAFEFILFAVMLVLYKKYRTKNLEIYCLAYGVFRFILEFFRGDDRGSTGFFLTPSQLMSLIIVIAGVLIILYKHKIIFKKLYEKAEGWKKEAALPMGVTTAEDVYACIERLHGMVESGALTEEEFALKKEDLLKRL